MSIILSTPTIGTIENPCDQRATKLGEHKITTSPALYNGLYTYEGSVRPLFLPANIQWIRTEVNSIWDYVNEQEYMLRWIFQQRKSLSHSSCAYQADTNIAFEFVVGAKIFSESSDVRFFGETFYGF